MKMEFILMGLGIGIGLWLFGIIVAYWPVFLALLVVAVILMVFAVAPEFVAAIGGLIFFSVVMAGIREWLKGLSKNDRKKVVLTIMGLVALGFIDDIDTQHILFYVVLSIAGICWLIYCGYTVIKWGRQIWALLV